MRRARIVFLILMAAGCGDADPAKKDQEAVDSWIAQHRPAMEAQLAHLRSIHAKAKSAMLGEEKLEKIDLVEKSSEIVALEDLENPGTHSVSWIAPLVSTEFLHDTAKLLATGKLPDPHRVYQEWEGLAPLFTMDRARDKLLGLEYVLVLRRRSYQPPKAIDAKTFTPGNYQGEVLVYRMKDEAFLGGVRIGVTNKKSVDVRNRTITDAYLEMDLEEGIKPVALDRIKAVLGR